jgi:nitrate reductase gamma subunit
VKFVKRLHWNIIGILKIVCVVVVVVVRSKRKTVNALNNLAMVADYFIAIVVAVVHVDGLVTVSVTIVCKNRVYVFSVQVAVDKWGHRVYVLATLVKECVATAITV